MRDSVFSDYDGGRTDLDLFLGGKSYLLLQCFAVSHCEYCDVRGTRGVFLLRRFLVLRVRSIGLSPIDIFRASEEIHLASISWSGWCRIYTSACSVGPAVAVDHGGLYTYSHGSRRMRHHRRGLRHYRAAEPTNLIHWSLHAPLSCVISGRVRRSAAPLELQQQHFPKLVLVTYNVRLKNPFH